MNLYTRITWPAWAWVNSTVDIIAELYSDLWYDLITDIEYESRIKWWINYFDINISDNKLNDQDKLFTTTDDHNLNIKNKTISQIKNISQEKKTLPKTQLNEIKGKIEIKDFDDLINICNQKKEIKLKYELETNVNLVSFEDQRIEISFDENLDKDFVKDLSTKLFGWTNKRWIITLSKKKWHVN